MRMPGGFRGHHRARVLHGQSRIHAMLLHGAVGEDRGQQQEEQHPFHGSEMSRDWVKSKAGAAACKGRWVKLVQAAARFAASPHMIPERRMNGRIIWRSAGPGYDFRMAIGNGPDGRGKTMTGTAIGTIGARAWGHPGSPARPGLPAPALVPLPVPSPIFAVPIVCAAPGGAAFLSRFHRVKQNPVLKGTKFRAMH
ncbi:hypothetical protein AWJ14_08095 [Hoeflea olei]|uniref:Uncharacterized protein n=2 Tax=Hoeflea olei TaxID=1480615 RepID=A0A1C1YUA4_9HYPH|nr:hypothetical protein AWJ14_08095 [Hoeflea olei]